jgi:penicillin amidase
MTHRSPLKKAVRHLALTLSALIFAGTVAFGAQSAENSLTSRAHASLAQHTGTLHVAGLQQSVEVLRDRWGIPHIYAQNTHDLFFAQGFVSAQDHMWQMELWRRNGEGLLSEVLGPEFEDRDRLSRLLTFRGDWDAEMEKYNPQGKVIFPSFAEGVNAAILEALATHKVPIEFQLMGFGPQPVWTAKTVLTRLPAWTISRNAASELSRSLAVKSMGLKQAQSVLVTDPYEPFKLPEGLDLDDINPHILDVARGADDFTWRFNPQLDPSIASQVPRAMSDQLAEEIRQALFPTFSNLDLGSNNWVVSGKRTVTGAPLLANDPHRELLNPSLRMLVHLTAPGWNVIGMTEPGQPGVQAGHNEDVAWGLTILGVDQQDLYIEETDPANPLRYRCKSEWRTMSVEHETLPVKGGSFVPFDVKTTVHGPVLYEDLQRHRAYALRWVGSEVGGAGYLGALNVDQAHDWKEFSAGVARSWYLPSHSIVYADTIGNIGYVGAALSPIRPNWDGLFPVPGADAHYEWKGFLPTDQMPRNFNTPAGFYNTSNNDVVPKILPAYSRPLGYEYSAPFRYGRVHEVLAQPKKFSMLDMESLQQDETSLPARVLVPLLAKLTLRTDAAKAAQRELLRWNLVTSSDSVSATYYEYWLMHLMAMAYKIHLPPSQRESFRPYDVRPVIAWMQQPDAAFGDNPLQARDVMMVEALEQAVIYIQQHFGSDPAKWQWGTLHRARLLHPLLTAETKSLLGIDSIARGGDGYTPHATGNPSFNGADQGYGASVMVIFDAGDWDRSVALNTPGNESQAGSPHYADLAPLWAAGKYFPLSFSRKMVEQNTTERLSLQLAP